VTFVRELVPSRVIATVGRLVYQEPFQAARIDARVTEGADGVSVAYRFAPAAREHRVAITGSCDNAVPAASSFAHYLKERTEGLSHRSDEAGCRPSEFDPSAVWATRTVRRGGPTL